MWQMGSPKADQERLHSLNHSMHLLSMLVLLNQTRKWSTPPCASHSRQVSTNYTCNPELNKDIGKKNMLSIPYIRVLPISYCSWIWLGVVGVQPSDNHQAIRARPPTLSFSNIALLCTLSHPLYCYIPAVKWWNVIFNTRNNGA